MGKRCGVSAGQGIPIDRVGGGCTESHSSTVNDSQGSYRVIIVISYVSQSTGTSIVPLSIDSREDPSHYED